MAINTAGQTATNTSFTDSNRYYLSTVTYDATSITTTDYTRITCGFTPTKIRVTNLTDRIQAEWFAGMAANTWLLTVAAGTRTLDTTASLLVVNTRSFDVLQNATAGLIAASKVVAFEAWA